MRQKKSSERGRERERKSELKKKRESDVVEISIPTQSQRVLRTVGEHANEYMYAAIYIYSINSLNGIIMADTANYHDIRTN